ncbi:VapC toxin family PIN domain ribonuclease [candidate division KSB3 bacterium]|uniref:VapC toxin family PIN domain ribonuclease n=1 Tax=candidate division KSB3 bacterium TaxID=2044937 RepID=A0A2G6KKA9_9BACT|nr:MAG: VapC toxin family PIN domain ribonuclease [candidate division KSB3 bacterium]
MNYLLDTCVISELVKPIPDQNAISWLHSTPNESLFLSVISIGEIRKGITKLPGSKKKLQLTNWLLSLTEDYSSRICPINLAVAENWGNIQGQAERNGTPLSSVDSLIAATAYTYNLIVVTRNEKDFIASNVSVLNPWVHKG